MSINDFLEFIENEFIISNRPESSVKGNNLCKERIHKCRSTGTIAIMCPNCYSNTKHMISVESTVSVVSNTKCTQVSPCINPRYIIHECKTCSCEDIVGIELDPNIADTISILNKKGYYTNYCCEGHNRMQAPYIYFSDLAILDVLHTLPLTWYIDYDELSRYNRLIIRADWWNREEALFEILAWANELESKVWRYW